MGSPEDKPVAQERNGDKITLRLSPEARASMEWIASKYGNVSLAEVIRRALGTEKFLLEQKDKGAAILIEEPGGRVKDVVFR
jgi:hypothetical protein